MIMKRDIFSPNSCDADPIKLMFANFETQKSLQKIKVLACFHTTKPPFNL